MRSPNDNAAPMRPAPLRRPPGLIAMTMLGLLVAAWHTPASAAAPEQEYRQALQSARSGDHARALETLSALVERYPDNRQYLYDYVAVLGWAERDREALDRATALDLAAAPAYVLEALGKSARNQQEYPLAVRIYRTALERDPEDGAARIGLALSLADSGEGAQAREALDRIDAARSRDPELLGALAYVQQRQGLPFQALNTYDRMLEIDPANREARRGRVLTAYRIGAPHLAAALADETPGLLSTDERDAIERDRQAYTIRWSRLPATPETTPGRESFKAIHDLRRELEFLETGGQGDTPHARQVRYDLFVSLHERGRDREAVELYETRIAADPEIPTYVLATAGDTYLTLRRPEQARDLFLRALEREPEDFNTRLSLFYAYVEGEDFEHALPLIDGIAAGEPAWLGVAPERRPNSARLRTDITAAYARAFADDLPEAERRLAPLAEQAPLNAELHTALATIQRWRGWPRRALGEYEIALHSRPENLPDARAGRGQALLEIGDYPAAEAALRELRATAPDSRATAALGRAWELHNLHELRLEASRTKSSGAQEGSDDLGFDGWLYGAPFRYHYRPFLHHHFEQAEFPEGDATYRRIGAGVEYRAREIAATVELDRNAGDRVDAGLAIDGRWSPSDTWSFTAGADTWSDEIPLRGRLNEDIDGWSVDLGADWRAHERRSAHVGLQRIDFSDDNLRTAANARVAQRLMTRPHYHMDGLLGVYASRNTREGAPYFNPASDLSVDLTLNNEWLLYRRYEYSFRHRLALSAGGYHQEDFGSDTLWAAQYEQRWSPQDRFDLVYGLIRARRVYDGVPEYQTTLYLNLDWRF
ncbi:MAG: poly-beta-1,6 N-acetyl-D-glucosamine export porin PgaA [Gammaproteobacteria bacterium]|nr:poly-beta-1,6 N-acetyl-D-glucosamine export porin PgaA [Gammaproteobacteria bacterium]